MFPFSTISELRNNYAIHTYVSHYRRDSSELQRNNSLFRIDFVNLCSYIGAEKLAIPSHSGMNKDGQVKFKCSQLHVCSVCIHRLYINVCVDVCTVNFE